MLQTIFELLEEKLVHVNVSLFDVHSEVVEEVQYVATLLECGPYSSECGDVDHHFPSLCVHLRKKEDNALQLVRIYRSDVFRIY